MQTTSKEKIKKAERLLHLIQSRLMIEQEEKELKEYFKEEIKEGVLEAGNVIILVECKVRTNLDRASLVIALGEKIKEFEKQTQYEQVTVKEKKGA